jgi:hypothetical protein
MLKHKTKRDGRSDQTDSFANKSPQIGGPNTTIPLAQLVHVLEYLRLSPPRKPEHNYEIADVLARVIRGFRPNAELKGIKISVHDFLVTANELRRHLDPLEPVEIPAHRDMGYRLSRPLSTETDALISLEIPAYYSPYLSTLARDLHGFAKLLVDILETAGTGVRLRRFTAALRTQVETGCNEMYRAVLERFGPGTPPGADFARENADGNFVVLADGRGWGWTNPNRSSALGTAKDE